MHGRIVFVWLLLCPSRNGLFRGVCGKDGQPRADLRGQAVHADIRLHLRGVLCSRVSDNTERDLSRYSTVKREIFARDYISLFSRPSHIREYKSSHTALYIDCRQYKIQMKR